MAMARRYGRARRGARVGGAVPHAPWKTATLLAALGTDGLSAPCVFDGAINGARFSAYVEQALAPTLRPGDVVTMDNLGAHKVKGVRQAIAAMGAPLSPALQSRTSRRSSRRQAQDRLPKRGGPHGRRRLRPRECTHYLVHLGCFI
jgi:hypothetical protein